MNQPQDITASITGFRLPVTPRILNERTVRTVHFPLSAKFQQVHNQIGGSVQGVTSHPSEPSETATSLPPGCLPWIHIAEQVLAGEFDGCDRSTAESLRIGLHRIEHPLCRKALARLPHVAKV